MYVHCAKAFRRSHTWDPSTWAALADAPDLAEIFTCQFGGNTGEYRAAVSDAYTAGLAEDRRPGA